MGGEEEDDVAQVARLLDLEAVAGCEGPEPVAEPAADRLAALERPALQEGIVAHDEDHVLRVVAHRAREIALVHRRELVADDLDVRLRHHAPSIPPRERDSPQFAGGRGVRGARTAGPGLRLAVRNRIKRSDQFGRFEHQYGRHHGQPDPRPRAALTSRAGPPSASFASRSTAVARTAQSGEWVDKPNYFDVTVWGAQGENCANYLSKGRPVAVQGRLDWREWEAQDGSASARPSRSSPRASSSWARAGTTRAATATASRPSPMCRPTPRTSSRPPPAARAAVGGGDDDIPF